MNCTQKDDNTLKFNFATLTFKMLIRKILNEGFIMLF